MFKQELTALLARVRTMDKSAATALPNRSYYLDKDTVVCYPTDNGDSRHPYYNDGVLLTPHSSGYIDCTDGSFNIFKKCHFNEDAPLAFFGGEQMGDCWFPYSITGAGRQLFEQGVERYTVFTSAYTWHITETPKAVFALRTYLDGEKCLRFTAGVLNTAEAREVYLCSYFEPSLRNGRVDTDPFSRMTLYGQRFENGNYLFKSLERTDGVFDFFSVVCGVNGAVTSREFTTAKVSFMGQKFGLLNLSTSLKNGHIYRSVDKTNTVDIPIGADLVHVALGENEVATLDYAMTYTKDEQRALAFVNTPFDFDKDDLAAALAKDNEIYEHTNIVFDDWHHDGIHPQVLNNFLKTVQKQVTFCALGKSYVSHFLGIRDVFQQVETALIWHPAACRQQIVDVLDCILDDGRAPRQVVLPTEADPIPEMDLRPFIDQGFWIIGVLHNYLVYTDDYSILDEQCGYFTAEATMGPISRSPERTTVWEHVTRITDYLISNIDPVTHGVHALYGDWNDALNGLGRTKDEGKEYGNGVSTMATLQMYLALCQMLEIVEHTTKDASLIERYAAYRDDIIHGVRAHALLTDQNGVTKMAHGWGDKQAYYVGSFCDFDGVSRTSLAANAYAGISEIMRVFADKKDEIANRILSLDSPYGFKTFDVPFAWDSMEQVGRICYITPGTYENSCAYVHAGTFGALALFMTGHAKEGWTGLEKAMTITHDNASMTTFVMPNSYCEGDEYHFRGDSMGDWHTGSGTVLIKAIIKAAFGVEPTFDGLRLTPANYFPSASARLTIDIKGRSVTVEYKNEGSGTRAIALNGQPLALDFDTVRETATVLIPTKNLTDGTVITITD